MSVESNPESFCLNGETEKESRRTVIAGRFNQQCSALVYGLQRAAANKVRLSVWIFDEETKLCFSTIQKQSCYLIKMTLEGCCRSRAPRSFGVCSSRVVANYFLTAH